MYSFGSGVLLGTRTDIPNATPVNFGLVQEVTIEGTATIKELTGQFQRLLAIARGTTIEYCPAPGDDDTSVKGSPLAA